MKALLFSNLFPTSIDVNRGVFTRQIAAELARLCELEVAVPLPWFPAGALAARLLPGYAQQFGGLAPTLEWDGVLATYPRYPLLPKLSENTHHRLMYLGVRRAIARRHRERKFDVINAHWLYPDGVAAAKLGASLGIPVVLTALGCDANEGMLNPVKRAHILAAAQAAAAITTVSQPLADTLIAAGVAADKVTVVPNGVDTQRFSLRDRASSRRALALDSSPLVVCVSRLSHEKGIDVLIDSMHTLLALEPRARVAIVGDGAARFEIEQRIAVANLGHAVNLVGAVPHAAVAEWMAAADVICIPSRREGHPNAAMEALACGRPLIASRVGALTTLIDSSCGLLVEPEHPQALGTALAHGLLAKWDETAIAASVREASWSRSAGSYYRVFEAAVQARPLRDKRAAAIA